MTTAAIITYIHTKLDGDTPINIPAIFDDVVPANGDSYEEITLQETWPPTPNMLVVKAVIAPETLALLKLNPRYGFGAVLWQSGEDFEKPATPRKWGQIAARIQASLNLSPDVVKSIMGDETQSLGQLIDRLIAWMRGGTNG